MNTKGTRSRCQGQPSRYSSVMVILILFVVLAGVSCQSKAVQESEATRIPEPTTEQASAVYTIISIDDGETTVGEATDVSITLGDAETGLSGYDITVSVANDRIAQIVDVVLPNFGLEEFGELPSTSIRIKAVDLKDIISPVPGEVTLATVTVKGISQGGTTVSLTVRAMDDDSGNPIQTEVLHGQISISHADSAPQQNIE